MGLIDVFTSSTGAVEDSEIEDLLEMGVTVAATGGAVAASGGTAGAAIALPIAGKILLEEGVKDYMKGVGKKGYDSLKDISEEYNEEEAAKISLGRACAGICKLADPLFDENIKTLTSDPDLLNDLIDRLFTEDAPNREELRKLEVKFSVILLGDDPPKDVDLEFDPNDKNALIEELKELFDTDDKREAIALFWIYEQFLSDLTEDFERSVDQESLSQDQRDALDSLSEFTDRMQKQLENFEELYLQTEIRNEGFELVKPSDFADGYAFEEGKNNRSPIEVWKTGFEFHELARETDDGMPYYFERSLPADHELYTNTTEAKTVSDAIVERLRIGEGNNVVLLGEPGMGKSHLGKLVATKWADQGCGDIFYHKSEIGSFKNIGALEESIKRAQDSWDGHVLVVVEDATREEANQVFMLIKEFLQESDLVSFLLDSRKAEWKKFTKRDREEIDPPHLFLQEDNSTFEEYSVPDVTKDDCEAAKNVFNKTTKGYYTSSAETLYDEVINEDTGQGELLALVDTLIRKGSFEDTTPIASNARKVHEKIWKRGVNDEDRLYYEIVVGSMLLTAAELGVHKSLLYTLIDPNSSKDVEYLEQLLDGQSDLSEQRSRPVPYELDEVFLFSTDGTTELYKTRHPTWAVEFLMYHINDSSVKLTFHEIVIDVVKKMTGLADKPNLRMGLKNHLEDQNIEPMYLNMFDENPSKTAERLLKQLYNFSVRVESVAPLFDAPDTGGLLPKSTTPTIFNKSIAVQAVPDACSDKLTFDLSLIFAEAIADSNSTYEKQEKQRELFTHIKKQAEENLDKPNKQLIIAEVSMLLAYSTDLWDRKQSHIEEAIKNYEEINHLSEVASAYRGLGGIAADISSTEWSVVKEYYVKAINTYRELEDISEVASTQQRLANTARQAPAVKWSDVDNYYAEAIDTYREMDELYHAAFLQSNLAGRAEEDSSTEWSDVERYYTEAIKTYREIGDLSKVGLIQESLASAAEYDSSMEWSDVEEYYARAIDTYQEINDLSRIASAQENLAHTAKYSSSTEWSDVEEYFTKAIEIYRELGDFSEVASAQSNLASFAESDSSAEWSDVEEYYNRAIKTYRELEDISKVAETQSWLARASKYDSSTGWSDMKEYYIRTIQTYREIGNISRVASAQQDLATAAADASTTEWSDVDEYYTRAIETYRGIGDISMIASTQRDLASSAADASTTEWSDVEEYYTRAIETYRGIGDISMIASTQRDLASSAADASTTEWSDVEEYYTRAIETYREVNNLPEVASTQRDLASSAANTSQTEWSDVEEYYKTAIETATCLSNETTLAGIYCDLANNAVCSDNLYWEQICDVVEKSLTNACACEPYSITVSGPYLTYLIHTLDNMVVKALEVNDIESADKWTNMVAQKVKKYSREKHIRELDKIQSLVDSAI